MDQLRQVGEVVGSLKALMVLKHEISINQRQCCLLLETMELAFETISEEMRQKLRLDEKNTKWKALELPLKELQRVLKDAECYVRYCMDIKDWWGKAISLHTNKDCVELHLHNLLSCFTVVIEAIETAAEISGGDEAEIQKKRSALLHKYDEECDDPNFFLWKYGKQFLVPREVCSRMETAWREDRWLLLDKVGERRSRGVAKAEQKLAELLLRKLNDAEASKKVMSSNMLVGAQDYQVRRRLGSGYPTGPGHLKEIHWLGESFALRTFIGDLAPLLPEISSLLSFSHPNILQYLCTFYDEGRKEGFLVMDLMAKDLGSYIKEHSGQRNRVPFTIPVAVDIMLQVARGMEYLHSINIHHGDLNPSHVLLKPRNTTTGGFQAKVTGFAMPAIKSCATRTSPKPAPAPVDADADIWLAPELLAELEQPGGKCNANSTEKGDVYSFGMLCFELLTGKVPFEDGHLQGEQIGRNIRAGERPLFSHPSPKCLVNLTRKCWQTNPSLRPSFSSICRILRYIKKILVINPDHGHPDSPPPLVDYCDLEAAYLKKFPGEGTGVVAPVSQIPFQMVAYKVVEKEKTITKKWDLATEGMVRPPASIFDEDQLAAMDDLFLVPTDRRSVCSDIIDSKNSAVDVDLRTVISETMQRKLYHFDTFVPEIPRKKYPKPPTAPETPQGKNVDEENSKSEQKSPTAASTDGKRLPSLVFRRRISLETDAEMAKQQWSLKFFSNHIDPEKEEQLKRVKIVVEDQVKNILRITNDINHGNKERNLRKKSEAIELIEDFHKQYEKLYILYENLRDKVKKSVDGEDNSCCSAHDSDSESNYYSGELNGGNDEVAYYSSRVSERDDGQESETWDVEDTPTCSSVVTKTMNSPGSPFFMSSGLGDILRDLEIQREKAGKMSQVWAEMKDLEEQVAALKTEASSLNTQKRQLEEQVECKSNEAVEAQEKISRLEAQIVEMKSASNGQERAFGTSSKPIVDDKQHYKSSISELEAQAEVMLLELNSLKHQKGELEVEGLTEQVSYLQHQLETLNSHKAELNQEIVKKSDEISEYLLQIAALRNELCLSEQQAVQEKESLKTKVQDLESEIELLSSTKRDLEEQVNKISHEASQSSLEKDKLQEKNSQLSTKQNELKDCQTMMFAKIKSLEEEVECLKSELETSESERNRLQGGLEALQNDKKQVQLELDKEKEQYKSQLERITRTNFHQVERKIEEMAVEFRKQLEDQYRILSRRIRVAEQLQAESKEWYRKTRDAYEQDNRDLKLMTARAAAALKNVKDLTLAANDLLTLIDSKAFKFEECTAIFQDRIFKASCEINFLREWAMRKNEALSHMKDDLDCLLVQLDNKEGEILASREKVCMLENKVQELEKIIEEKEDDMLGLTEEKREAIRQLCVWIDYHRCQSDFYKNLLSDMNRGSRRAS